MVYICAMICTTVLFSQHYICIVFDMEFRLYLYKGLRLELNRIKLLHVTFLLCQKVTKHFTLVYRISSD